MTQADSNRDECVGVGAMCRAPNEASRGGKRRNALSQRARERKKPAGLQTGSLRQCRQEAEA